MAQKDDEAFVAAKCGYHMRVGWWCLVFFAVMGTALDAMHGLKLPFYLGVSQETRRLMWTLCHAHGTLLSIVHILFSLTLQNRAVATGRLELVSQGFSLSTVLLPLGFFLGGFHFYVGDPGIGV